MPPLAAIFGVKALGDIFKQKWFWIFIIVLFVVIVSIITVKKINEHKRNKSGKTADFNKEGITVDTSVLNTLARRLYNSMNGFNLWSFGKDERSKAFEEMLKLNDDEFKFTYNAFNDILGNATSETLRDWINSESIVDFTSGADLEIIARMDKLGLA